MDSAKELIKQVLLLRCQIGDRDAFAELIGCYQKPLRYFISRLLDDEAVTEDVIQDTWLSVIKKIHGLKDVEAFPTWLYRIARNKVYQHLRRNKRTFELDENLAVANDVEENVFSADDAAKIHQCMTKLKPVHKEVLLLRFLEQMSYEQIAMVIDCNIGTVRSRIYYAKIALRKEMEK
jgi:RNA polymerase sigma-70 factor (ECF subfamily)